MKRRIAKIASALLYTSATLFAASFKLTFGSPEAPKELLNK